MFAKSVERQVAPVVGAVKRVFRFGELEFSSPPSRLTRNGAAVHLRPQVMRTLTELVEHPGEVVTREYLRQTIWRDIEHVEVERGIKTVIRELRKALGDDAKDPRYVETIRGVGYRFVAPGQVETELLVQENRPPRRQPARMWFAGAAVFGVLGILAIAVILSSPERPTLLMPRMRAVDSAPELTPICDQLNEQLAKELVSHSSEVDLVHILVESTSDLSMSPRVARYFVDGHLSRGETDGSYYIAVELIDRIDDTIVWIGTYELSETDVNEWARQAGRELVEAVAAAQP